MKNENVLMLAYIGDVVFEMFIREMLIKKGIVKVDTLQKEAIKYVSAKAQSVYLKKIIDSDFLDDIEKEVMMRSRNHKSNKHPKNTDILTYKHATALEAIIGYLYLDHNFDRLNALMKEILEDNYVRIW